MHKRALSRRDLPRAREKLPRMVAVSRSARAVRRVRSSADEIGEKRKSRSSGSQ